MFNGHNDNDGECKDIFQGFTPLDSCNIPPPVERFDFEYDKKPRSPSLQHSTDCFDYESECDKKLGNHFSRDESSSSPKVRYSCNLLGIYGYMELELHNTEEAIYSLVF